MPTTTLTRAKYSGLDFQTHFDDLLARVQVQFATEYSDFVVTGLGIMLLDIISFGLDALSFYLDRRATDTFLETARTTKSVTRLARQLGYKPRSAVSASTTLKVSLTTGGYAFPVPIPKDFQFKGPNNLIFSAADLVTIPAGTPAGVEFDVPVYEGVRVSENFTSTGLPNQVFELRRVPKGKYMVSGTPGSSVAVQTWVNALLWSEYDLLSFDPTNQYEVAYTDSPPTLRFGDGTTGNIPTTGANIKIDYVYGSGKAGMVLSNTIQAVQTPLVVGFVQIPLTVNNPDNAAGGDDPESLGSIKYNAPRLFNTRLSAVTGPDYDALAGSYSDPLFGKVSVAKALSSRSADDDLELRSLLLLIQGAVSSSATAVDTAITGTGGGNDLLDSIDTELSAMSSDLSSAASKATTANNDLTSAATVTRTNRNRTQEIDSGVSDITSEVLSGKAAVDAITTAATDQLTVATKNVLKGYFTNCQTEATGIQAASSAIYSNVATELALISDAQAKLDEIGLTTSSGKLGELEASRAIIATDAGTSGPPTTGLRKVLDDIYVVIVTGATSMQDMVDAAAEDIFNHVDLILSADCKANLVTVPILVVNSSGFYTAPSSSLIRSLQTYLDARKEVTQTVRVVSGADWLVGVKMRLRVGVLPGVSFSVTEATIKTLVDGILKGRKFGHCLYESDIIDPIVDEVAGVDFVNVTFTEPTAQIDGDGNVIITENQIVTKSDDTDAVQVTLELVTVT